MNEKNTASEVNKISYEDKVNMLSEASVRRNFDAFLDIDWDSPENAIVPNDERWILDKSHVLGAHPWYQSLPIEEQIRVGTEVFANMAKVGSQFELPLVAGITAYANELKNGDPDFRYSMHEATEETHHIQMFQQTVNKLGVDTKGTAKWFRVIVPALAPIVARKYPVGFWTTVLAGEEPIDHVQKEFVREQGENMHPLANRVMNTHIAEEARHISFAHEYLTKNIPRLNTPQRMAMAVLYPMTMRILADVIMRPSREALADIGIPKDVADDVWWGRKASKKYLSNLFPDARMLAEDVELKNGKTKTLVGAIGSLAWKAFGIDGRASRFRNEPNRTHDPLPVTR